MSVQCVSSMAGELLGRGLSCLPSGPSPVSFLEEYEAWLGRSWRL